MIKKIPREIKRENEVLRSIVQNTLWMARRYADGRMSYAVSTYNDAVHALDDEGLGHLLKPEPEHLGAARFANDGMFGTYDPETRRYIPVAKNASVTEELIITDDYGHGYKKDGGGGITG